MAEVLPISVVIVARNEARNLPRCLESVQGWVAEIVVVLNDTTDDSEVVAERHGAVVFETEWRGFRDTKNWALAHASQPWALALDADEEVSPALQADLKAFFSRGDQERFVGARFPRKVWFIDRWITHGDWYPDLSLRLLRRDRTRWREGRTELHRHVVCQERLHFLGRLRIWMLGERPRCRWSARGRLHRKCNAGRGAEKVRRFRLLDVETELSECRPQIKLPEALIECSPLELFDEMRVARRQPWADLFEHCTRWRSPFRFDQELEIRMQDGRVRSLGNSQKINWVVCLVALMSKCNEVAFLDGASDPLPKRLGSAWFGRDTRANVGAAKSSDLVPREQCPPKVVIDFVAEHETQNPFL